MLLFIMTATKEQDNCPWLPPQLSQSSGENRVVIGSALLQLSEMATTDHSSTVCPDKEEAYELLIGHITSELSGCHATTG